MTFGAVSGGKPQRRHSRRANICPDGAAPRHKSAPAAKRPTHPESLVVTVLPMAMVMLVFLFHHGIWPGFRRSLFHIDRDDLGLNRRFERNVGPIAEHEL